MIKPIITEKATNDSELNNRYTFQVNVKSNKVEIKKAVEKAYGEENILEEFSKRTGMLIAHFGKYNILNEEIIERIILARDNDK